MNSIDEAREAECPDCHDSGEYGCPCPAGEERGEERSEAYAQTIASDNKED